MNSFTKTQPICTKCKFCTRSGYDKVARYEDTFLCTFGAEISFITGRINPDKLPKCSEFNSTGNCSNFKAFDAK